MVKNQIPWNKGLTYTLIENSSSNLEPDMSSLAGHSGILNLKEAEHEK